MRFASLSSGSDGNASYIGTEEAHILIDCGVGIRTIEAGLKALDLSLQDIDAIFLTHEHFDHIKALGSILRKQEIPVYASLGTLQGTLLCKSLKDFPKELLNPIITDRKWSIKDLDLFPFSIHHDTREPLAYRAESGEKHCAIATDLGSYDEYTIKHLRDTDVLLLEANHDIEMLEKGPYPLELKRRILSDFGHLSNESSATLLEKVAGSTLRQVFLGHLSKENNTPNLALQTIREKISENDLPITVAKHGEISAIVEW